MFIRLDILKAQNIGQLKRIQKHTHKRCVSEISQYKTIFGNDSPDRFKKFLLNNKNINYKYDNINTNINERPKSCKNIKQKHILMLEKIRNRQTEDVRQPIKQTIQRQTVIPSRRRHSASYSSDSQFTYSQFFTSERQRKCSFKKNKIKQIQHKKNDLQSTQISLSSIQYQKRKNSQNMNKVNQNNQNKKLTNNQKPDKLKNKTSTIFFKSIHDIKHFRRQNRRDDHSKSFCQTTNKFQQNQRIDPSSLQIHLSVQSLVTQNNKKQQKQQQIRVVEIFRNDMKKLITSRTKNNKPIMIKLNKRLIYNHKQMNGSFIKISKIITDVEKDWED